MSTPLIPRILSEEEQRDLGFGSVVSRESRLRLLNRDGTFNVARKGLNFWSSLNLYHSLLTMSWWKFYGLVTLFYLLLNAVFAVAYMLCGADALRGATGDSVLGDGFGRAFFFSVETFSTIGYGNIVPVGFAANTLVTLESLIGLLAVALSTGMLFARFSRPTALIVFSKKAIIAPYKGITAFEFRITNGRSNEIIEMGARVVLTRFEQVDGHRTRRYYNLTLERDKVAFLPLSWTIVHPIDEASPMLGITHEDMREANAEFLILLTGIDETFSQTVHTRSSYIAEEIVWNARFVNLFQREADEDMLTVDVRRLDNIEMVETSAGASS
jgi:inward rectifier potassium channel